MVIYNQQIGLITLTFTFTSNLIVFITVYGLTANVSVLWPIMMLVLNLCQAELLQSLLYNYPNMTCWSQPKLQ